jgi:hypothetical protein
MKVVTFLPTLFVQFATQQCQPAPRLFEMLIPFSRRPSTGLNAVADLRQGKVPFVLNDTSVLYHGGVLDHPLWLDITFQPRIVITRISGCGKDASTLVTWT